MLKVPKISYIFAIFSEKYGDEVDFLCADKHKLFLQIDIIDLIMCVYVMCLSVYGLSFLFLFKCQDRPRSSLHMPPYPQGKWRAPPCAGQLQSQCVKSCSLRWHDGQIGSIAVSS